MRIKVCSGWAPSGSKLYGRRFLDSFDRHWNSDVLLEVYTEEPEPMPRGACRSLWDIPGARELIIKTDTLRHRGRDKNHGKWKRGALEAGYNFKWDAKKFFKQCIIPQQAAIGMQDNDILVWLDGDVITTSSISQTFIESLIGPTDICYLGRTNTHAEIGFYAVRINDKTRAFLADMAEIYISGEFEIMPETHSSWIWGVSKNRSGLIEKNLTPGRRGHVFPQSPLAVALIHNKGKRKGEEK